MNELDPASTRPYLLRAIHEWCTDHQLTPFIAVRVDETVQVPREVVQNGEVVLNVSYDATGALQMGNEFVSFKARFAGVARDIMVPVDRILAIYARENGQGMAFAMPAAFATARAGDAAGAESADVRVGIQLVTSDAADGAGRDGNGSGAVSSPEPVPPRPTAKRPALKRVK